MGGNNDSVYHRWKDIGGGNKHLGRYKSIDGKWVKWVGKKDPFYQRYAEQADLLPIIPKNN